MERKNCLPYSNWIWLLATIREPQLQSCSKPVLEVSIRLLYRSPFRPPRRLLTSMYLPHPWSWNEVNTEATITRTEMLSTKKWNNCFALIDFFFRQSIEIGTSAASLVDLRVGYNGPRHSRAYSKSAIIVGRCRYSYCVHLCLLTRSGDTTAYRCMHQRSCS